MLKKPKMCFITTSPVLSDLLLGICPSAMGGAELQQVLIAKILMEMGCQVTFLVHDRGQPDEVYKEDGLRLIKAYRKTSLIGKLILSPYYFWRALKLADADVYNQHAGGTMIGIMAFYCKLIKRPYVYAVSIDIDLDGTKERNLNYLKRVIYRYGIFNATEILVLTDHERELLCKRFHREGFVIRLINLPDKLFEAETISLAETPSSQERRHILWVSSFRDHKHPELFVELAARIPEQKFVMVGGPFPAHPELFDVVKKQSEGLPNITLAGLVPYDKVGDYFDKAKIFVCTSAAEGFPNTFLQAWSRGVPVVSTFDPDTLIQRLGLGRYCRTLDEVEEAVRLLSTDNALRESIGAKAIDYIKQNHHPDVIRDRYKELMRALEENRKRF